MKGFAFFEIILKNSKIHVMNLLQRLGLISTFVFDVDGVLTDGSLLVLPNGVIARRMNVKDGYALQLAVKRGYRVIIISGGNSPEVRERLAKLGVHEVWMNVENKLECLQDYIEKHQLQTSEVLFMGDDIPDFELMTYAGVSSCPNDAVAEIKQQAHYISPINGGFGCVREVIEKVMKIRGDWQLDTTVKSK